jgi:hypothetical protein
MNAFVFCILLFVILFWATPAVSSTFRCDCPAMAILSWRLLSLYGTDQKNCAVRAKGFPDPSLSDYLPGEWRLVNLVQVLSQRADRRPTVGLEFESDAAVELSGDADGVDAGRSTGFICRQPA